MSTVYLAEDTVLGRRVALKVVATAASRPEIVERMRAEARVIARLEHPGIVPVHDAGMLPDGRVYYAMKRVDGKRLDELAPAMALPERLRVFQRICEAVAFAHAHGVVHRDLKPENVMIGAFGEVLVMDWGVAKVLADPDGASAASPAPAASGTADGQVIGTLAYMAPEQAEGSAERTGTAADVYALGAILYFLLTGRAPFDDAAAGRRARGEARRRRRPRGTSTRPSRGRSSRSCCGRWRPIRPRATRRLPRPPPKSRGFSTANACSPTGRTSSSGPGASSRATRPRS